MLTANGKALCKLNNAYGRTNNETFKYTNSTTGTRSTQQITSLLYSLSLYVGTGTDTPTSQDYQLFNQGAGLTRVTYNGTNDATSASYTQDYIGIFSATYRNDTSANITVTEVGVIGTAGQTGYDVLIARDLIDPVTIAPGEAYTFTMYIG